jgi:hypothetical protein
MSDDERAVLVNLLAHLAEFDRRKLYGPLGCSSLFTYCTTRLRFSEESAYRRIHAARVSRKYPEALPMIADGRLQLSAIAALSVHLTDENHLDLLDRACGELYFAAPTGRGESAVETSTAAPPLASPRDETSGSPGTTCPCPSPPPRIDPVAPDRIRFSFTGDEALLRMVERTQAILWHKHPAGKLEDIFAEALDFLLDKKDPERRLEKKKRLKRKPPSIAADKESRHIPQWVKDEVWARDGGRCAFIPPDGKRCPEREGLEFDHVVPWALGGRSHDPRNIRLLCRGHNQMMARRLFGGKNVKRPGE